jgi:hypothetical protein
MENKEHLNWSEKPGEPKRVNTWAEAVENVKKGYSVRGTFTLSETQALALVQLSRSGNS